MKDFLEANGCHVKVERGNRVFPVSDRASDVTSAFARRLRELRVKVELNQGVRELWLEDGGQSLVENDRYPNAANINRFSEIFSHLQLLLQSLSHHVSENRSGDFSHHSQKM